MEYRLCRLLPRRPTFDHDISEAEGRLRHEHKASFVGQAKEPSFISRDGIARTRKISQERDRLAQTRGFNFQSAA